MTDQQQQQQEPPQLVVSYRGNKVEISLREKVTVQDVKQAVAESAEASVQLQAADIKLMFKGKVLLEDDAQLSPLLQKQGLKKKTYRLVATGVSLQEAADFNETFVQAKKHAPRVANDLTENGRTELKTRQRLSRQMMQKSKGNTDKSKYGFGRIETLPGLPNEQQARAILTQLANDPGILACCIKREWSVGSLAELYPAGKVGESAVCVMGLNKNAGQQILLRIRTDDLLGFRKIASIRKVLYHELAHNVHSTHDTKFFQLNRQVEKECTELDWTNGAGLSSVAEAELVDEHLYTAGTYRLGGTSAPAQESTRELAARAALLRLTAEEEEMQANCGCGRTDLFLPESATSSSSHTNTEEQHRQDKDDDGMDVS